MIIIKVGGGKDINWDYIAKDALVQKESLVFVHGANAYMKEISQKLGLEEKVIISPSGQISRYTDSKTMEILTMVYSGFVNKNIVATMQKYGINAIGLSGVDGKMWQGERKKTILSQEGNRVKVIRDSLTGKVTLVNSKLLKLLVANGYTPVITVPAVTREGELINVDNDRAVSVMARDLNIKKIVMLFEAPGLLENPENENSVIKNVSKDQLDNYIVKTKGRMRKKILGVKEAFSYRVKTVYFGDGRIKNPITQALKGKGTIIN